MFNDSLMTRSSLKILKTICSTGIQSVGVEGEVLKFEKAGKQEK